MYAVSNGRWNSRVIKIKIIVMGIICISFLAGCSKNNKAFDSKVDYISISQEVAKEMIDNEEVIVLDVRTMEEYNQGHIKDAILIPHTSIKENINKYVQDKEQTVLVYCRSGNRSKQASKILAELGYINVFEFGGINTWKYELE